MTGDELRAFVQRLRKLATQQPSLSSKIAKEASEIRERVPRKLSAKVIKTRAAIDED